MNVCDNALNPVVDLESGPKPSLSIQAKDRIAIMAKIKKLSTPINKILRSFELISMNPLLQNVADQARLSAVACIRLVS
jgi:hypothetical protein